jgi:hypothetical protein
MSEGDQQLEREQRGEPLFCSFCGKSQDQIRKLVAGPNCSICDECVEICADIVSDDRPADPEAATRGREPSPELTARCSLCRRPAPVEEFIPVVSRGAVCRPCLAAAHRTPLPNLADDKTPPE